MKKKKFENRSKKLAEIAEKMYSDLQYVPTRLGILERALIEGYAREFKVELHREEISYIWQLLLNKL